ncbi:SusC/RagA family TonB-linked outer membrane protein [Maribacter ulvicola]|uniref:TonB-linked outer membrane protein, SusC/RagA family n=1 Tax=Maribacter ulvicola TaxID=228959 RepID=A0A1N7A007_9FLAO|nr:SusC/RagA family TonB-linked outer membrane protein [Maribacter ulvicola]SIR32349.1 TonB-linked outer membrane protein, SusC/RagA family [Maribacter ulvicola]
MKLKNLEWHNAVCIASLKVFSLVLLAFTSFSMRGTPTSTNHRTMKTVQQTITGTITDDAGAPLPGVNVLVVGTNRGVQSDFDGNYSITATNGDILRFSYLGLKTSDIEVGIVNIINVTLQEDINSLEEVVVVGYNSIIKKKITGSVATIKTEELNEIPATTLGGAIAGRLAGVNISSSGGRPGRSANINVRGATTGAFGGGTAPLYVIDGIVLNKEQFDALDVNEVQSISVLKDAASTSAYGARASNGVILVTTKTGKGKPKINFTSTIGTTEPTKVPEFNSAYNHALLTNSGLRWNKVDPSDAGYITTSELDYLKASSNEGFLKDFEKTPILKRYTASISGSTDRVSYFLSGSKIDESAAFDNLTYDRTNFRAKVGVDVTDNLNVSMNINTSRNDDYGFYWSYNYGDEDYGDFYRTVARSGYWGPSTKNGLYVANYNGWNAGNLINNGAGYQTRDNKILNTRLKIDYNITAIEGLSAGMSYNSNIKRDQDFLFRKPLVDYTFATDPNNRFLLTDEIVGTRVRNDSGADSNSVYESTNEVDSNQFNLQLNYSNTFGNHDLSLFAIYEQFESKYKGFGATGRQVPTELVPTLNATASDDERAFGSKGEDGRQSVIGGLNYSYKEKYLLSSTFRYDGSVRFAEGRRFGFFPSVSLGWIVSQENFFKNNLGFLDFFKIRYSIGQTGNDNVGVGFPYVQKYNLGTGAVFGEDIASSSVNIGAQPQPFITWEKQTSYNFGLDFKTLKNKLATSIDIFKNKKRDLFGSRQLFIPESSGLSLNPENYGGIDISGFEVLTSYNTRINKDFDVEAGFNMGYSKAIYAEIDDPESTLPRFIRKGNRLDRIRTYVSDGIIRNQEQLDALIATGFTQFGRAPKIGELLMRDVRGNRTEDPNQNTPDGIVDGNDLEYIKGSHSSAPINYGIRFSIKYKNFRVQAFAQGFANYQRFIPQSGRFTLSGIGQSSWTHWNDSWTPENENASFPVFGGDSGWQQRESTFFLNDADFLRMKNLNVSYDLSKDVLNKIGVSNLSLFINTTNLFMIYSKIKSFDPETSGRGIPVNKTYSLGLNITL